jgi:SAM-dependent methyltransferase
MAEGAHVWQSEELARLFLEDIRGAIPLANEQIDVLLRVVRVALPKVERFLDLGCGDGILGRAVLREHSNAAGVFLDFSDTMIAAAKKAVAAEGRQATFVAHDFGLKSWVEAAKIHAPFDLVVSGLAIHHQNDERKREIYWEIFDLLKPGGLFLNLEHVAFAANWAHAAFDDLFVDSLCVCHKRRGGVKTREEIAQEFYYRRDKDANILAPLDLQCRWLGEIGYIDVDCFFKLFETALFGWKRP